MTNDYVLQARTFVDFLNNEFNADLKNTPKSHFELEDLLPHFLFGVGRQKIVLNNMYNPIAVNCYNRNIEKVADVFYSKGTTKHFSFTGFKAEGWERLRIDIVNPIRLKYSKVIEPQNLLLHRTFILDENISYLEQLKGPEQLAYENGAWKFAD